MGWVLDFCFAHHNKLTKG